MQDGSPPDAASPMPFAGEAHPMEPGPAPGNSVAEPANDGDLGVLFARDSSKADRMRAMRELGLAVRARLSASLGGAEQGRDALAERSARLLSEVAARLPIRTAETLRRQFGEDREAQSRQVIAQAGRIARFLWAGAAAVPGPPPVVQAVKVVVHSAIEIRMIGELYAIHDNRAYRDEGWLGAVIMAWASDQPVAPGGSVTSTTAAVATKIRSVSEFVGGQSRASVLASRGRNGADAVLRSGARMHRRMRLHPSSWARPGTDSIGTVVFGVAKQVAVDSIGDRVPQALVAAARDRLTPSADAAVEEPTPVPVFADPREALAHARALQQQATAAMAATSTSDPDAMRMRAALTAQKHHLADLEHRLGTALPASAQRRSAVTGDAALLMRQVEDAFDAVEETGERSRRLPSWSTRRRAGLVYLVAALAVSALPAVALLGSSGTGMIGLLLAQCLGLPWLSLAAGAIAIGPLFRPWLGGPVRRHPVIGAGIVLAVHVGAGAFAAVLGILR